MLQPVTAATGSRAKGQLVLTDGWMDGWDGWSEQNIIFFGDITKTTQYFFLIVFGPLRRLLETSLLKKTKEIKKK